MMVHPNLCIHGYYAQFRDKNGKIFYDVITSPFFTDWKRDLNVFFITELAFRVMDEPTNCWVEVIIDAANYYGTLQTYVFFPDANYNYDRTIYKLNFNDDISNKLLQLSVTNMLDFNDASTKELIQFIDNRCITKQCDINILQMALGSEGINSGININYNKLYNMYFIINIIIIRSYFSQI
jgi:hypothetical protein